MPWRRLATRSRARFPGGKAYWYRVFDGHSGDLQVVEAEPLAGKSPRAIAKQLDSEGLRGPDGHHCATQRSAASSIEEPGVLNNAIYVGRLEWNRCSYVKDPDNRKTCRAP